MACYSSHYMYYSVVIKVLCCTDQHKWEGEDSECSLRCVEEGTSQRSFCWEWSQLSQDVAILSTGLPRLFQPGQGESVAVSAEGLYLAKWVVVKEIIQNESKEFKTWVRLLGEGESHDCPVC